MGTLRPKYILYGYYKGTIRAPEKYPCAPFFILGPPYLKTVPSV